LGRCDLSHKRHGTNPSLYLYDNNMTKTITPLRISIARNFQPTGQGFVIFLVTALFMLASSSSRSASLSVKTGLETISGNFSYVQGHLPVYPFPVPHFDTFKNVDKSFTVGALGISAELDEPVAEKCFVGVALSGGIPFMSFPFKMSDLIDPDPGVENIDEGDESRGNIAMAKMMLKGGYRASMGPGEASLTLGAGMVLYSLTWKQVDQWWDNGSGVIAPFKLVSSATKYATITTYSNSTATVPVVEAAPGYHIKIGDNYRIGLEVPVSLSAKQKLTGIVTSPAESIIGIFPANCNAPVVEVGGFSWAAYLVFAKVNI